VWVCVCVCVRACACVCVCVCVCVCGGTSTHKKNTPASIARVCSAFVLAEQTNDIKLGGGRTWCRRECFSKAHTHPSARASGPSARRCAQKHTAEHTRIQALERVGHPLVVVRVIFHDDDVHGKSIWAWVRASERVWDPRRTVCALSRHMPRAHLPSATRQAHMHHGHTDGCTVKVRSPHATIEWVLQWRM
jgi:hypothetical protein